MTPITKISIIAIIVLLAIIGGIIAWFLYKGQEEKILDSCTELGCSEGSIYVGSINSDKYYQCDCHYADQILPQNIICFSSDEDALSKGYTMSEC